MVLKHLKIVDAEKQFVFEENLPEKKATKYPFVTPCSIFQAIKLFVDLRGSVSKKTLKNFAVYCQDPKEKEKPGSFERKNERRGDEQKTRGEKEESRSRTQTKATRHKRRRKLSLGLSPIEAFSMVFSRVFFDGVLKGFSCVFQRFVG